MFDDLLHTLNHIPLNCSHEQFLVRRQWAISELTSASVSKRVFVPNLLYENEFGLHENKPVGEIHFHMIDFTHRFVLRPRQKATRK